MGQWTWLIIVGVVVAFIFDFYNGVHDSANAIATVVATRVLRPVHAVFWAALWNVAAYFVFHTAVAKMIAGGIVEPHALQPEVVIAGLLGAIAWSVITLFLGLPISSSHALIGGVVGAAFTAHGASVLQWAGINKVLTFIVIAPVLGMVFGGVLMVLAIRTFWRASPARIDRWFRVAQLFSSAAYALGHGGNDAQKTAGIVTLLLVSGGILADPIPPWQVLFVSYLVMGLGTALGGWRIVRTMGTRITELKPVGGFCAETGGALMLYGASHFGIPVSTTHTITGAIVGVGSVRRLSAVRWGVTMRVVWAWVFTIPFSALAAGLIYYLCIRPFVH